MDSNNKISSADKSHQSKVVIANHNKIANTSSAHNNQTKTNQSDSNFEYEDNEWDIGIGDLIIDLDADIEKSSNVDSTLMIPLQTLANSYSTSDKLDSPEKTNITDSANMSTMSNSGGSKNSTKLSIDNHQATLDKGLKMKIKRTKLGNKTSDAKHEIVKSETDAEDQPQHNKNSPTSALGVNKRGNSSHKKEKQSKTHCKDKPENSLQDTSSSCNCDSDKMSSSPCSSCFKESSSSQGDKSSSTGSNFSSSSKTSSSVKDHKGIFEKDTSSSTSAKSSNDEDFRDAPPPSKRPKCDLKDMVDVCVGTSIGTITEPECLGPCEPGTSVTLEGIVWHESEGGVLAVNVTWRGKTYVGTLIDCTKHDWAPPRFCDSPTEDLESRLQKGGRSKRGRNATNDLLNFTETRSSVHSKLRNGSKVPKQDKRRKSKDESPSASVNGNSFQANVVNNHAGNIAAAQKQLAAKKTNKNLITPCAISPVLIECPEQDCSKKYKHANGLKYHQSHAHGTNFSAEDEVVPPDSPTASVTSEQNKIPNDKPEDTDKKSITQKLDESTNDAESVDKNIKDSSVLIRDIEDGSANEKSNDFKALESDGISNESSMDPNFFQLNSQNKNNLNTVRCKKNRKSPTVPPCENVRSPAYSDISDDDSNAPTDNSIIDKKASELQKSSAEPAGSMLLGSYNHLSFYQSPAFLQSSDHLKPLNQITSPEGKEQTPLDLISKMHLEKAPPPPAPTELPSATNEQSPLIPKGPPYQHFPYSLMQTSFPFNGESFPPFPPTTTIDDKNSPIVLKQEKEILELPKQTLSVKPLSRLEEVKEIKIEPDQQPQQQPGGFLNYSKYATLRDDDHDRRSSLSSSNSSLKTIKEESTVSIESGPSLQSLKHGSSKSGGSSSMKSHKDIKEEKEFKPNKNEGQKPTMETQGPPPPPTNQYYLNLPYHLAGSGSGPPFFADHAIYRNMLVPSSYNSPYHLQNLQMARFSSPEDLSRNTANTKALDLLQQHASQYYNTHKIHELNDRVNQLSKSPSNNIRMSASGIPNPSNVIHGNSSMPILPPGNNVENRASNPTRQSPGPANCDATKVLQLNNSKLSQPPERGDPKDVNRTSPPPQRHHHTHHHTHVYPIYGTPFNPAAVLGTPPAVAVINPFANPPPK